MVVGFTLTVQSVPITTNGVRSNLANCEVYSVQHYVIKFVSDLPQVGGFVRVHMVSSTNEIDRHNIAEIFLKVTLNTNTLTLFYELTCPRDTTPYIHIYIPQNSNAEWLLGQNIFKVFEGTNR